MDIINKRTNTTYLKVLAYKSQEFLGNRHFLCLFSSQHIIHICTSFCCVCYHPHHLWLHHCCWLDHSDNTCHMQQDATYAIFDFLGWREYGCKPNFLKSVILSVADSVPDEASDLLKDIYPNKKIRKMNLMILQLVIYNLMIYTVQWWSKKETYPYMASWNFIISRYG